MYQQFTPKQQFLLWALSLLDCVEVAVEMMSEVAFREAGKWVIVTLLQIVKYVILHCMPCMNMKIQVYLP